MYTASVLVKKWYQARGKNGIGDYRQNTQKRNPKNRHCHVMAFSVFGDEGE
jgi:hypothetical protein